MPADWIWTPLTRSHARTRTARLRRAGAGLRTLPLVVFALLVLLSSRAGAAKTRYFPHDDRRYLHPGQKNGGAAYIPSGMSKDRALPVIVFLHGTNASRQAHLWFGAGGRDLRPLAESLVATRKVAPFVLAAPSQTKSAALPGTLWNDFDFARFIADLRRALAGVASIDEQRLILLGHSGAGCNPAGGLARDYPAGGPPNPAVLVAIDPCLNQSMGSALARLSPEIPLWMLWQSRAWSRDIEGWLEKIADRPLAPVLHELNAPLPNPHESIVPMALELVARELVGPPPPEAGSEPASVSRLDRGDLERSAGMY